MLQVGVDHREIRRRAREHALDAGRGEAAPADAVEAAHARVALRALAHQSSVPSKASSTTTIASQSRPASACSSASSSGRNVLALAEGRNHDGELRQRALPAAMPARRPRATPTQAAGRRSRQPRRNARRRVFEAQPMPAPVERHGAQGIVGRHDLVAAMRPGVERHRAPRRRPGIGHEQHRRPLELRVDFHEIAPFAQDSGTAGRFARDRHRRGARARGSPPSTDRSRARPSPAGSRRARCAPGGSR